MNRKLKIYHKWISIVTGLFLVLQSLVPGFFALESYVFAQEETPVIVEPTQTEEDVTPTPTDTIAPTPENDPSDPEGEVTPEVTPEPTVEPTPSEDITPAPEPTQDEVPGPTGDEPPHETSPPDNQSEGEILDGVSSTEMPTPKVETTTTEGQITAVVYEEVMADTLNLDSVDLGSATLSTDKADYAPTDTVVITGTSFEANTEYSLSIISSDTPTYSFQDTITTDSEGTFTYAHQLDGTYRPNYQVFVASDGTTIASTAFTDSPVSGCYNDSAGANDEPGQKDLTKACVDYAGLPTNIAVSWNWDEINGSGNNTYDACSLYDTDTDGFANYAACVTLTGIPLAQNINSPRIYTCNDTKADRCAGASLVAGPYTTSCTATQANTDPFATGDVYPQDSVASCTVSMTEVGGITSGLLDVCSFPSEQPNSDPSDCVFASTAAQTGLLEVVKVLSPVNDTGLFNLQIDSTSFASNVGNGATTGEKIVVAGNHTVGETAGTGTSLGDYSSTIVCKDRNGGGNTIASSSNAGPLTVNVANSADVVCTITNTRAQGTLHVIKTVINDNGGTLGAADFSFQVDGGTAQAFEVDGQNDLTVNPGTYDITEPAVTGYTTTYDNCSDVVVSNGGTATCTITNDDDQPLLTVTKVVTNDNGGDAVVADFPLFVDATLVTSGEQNVFNAGNYVVSETGLTGYTPTFTGDCDAQGNVTLALGDVKECTITNDDVAPTITLIKEVTNDNGGTATAGAFILSLGNTQVTSGVPTEVDANTPYEIDEAGPLGYEFVSLTGDPECPEALAGNVVADEGEQITCTITNTDQQATLTLVKHLPNDNGGAAIESEFNVYIDATLSSWGAHSVDAGTYVISEDTLNGYSASTWGGDCDENGNVTLLPGESKTCEVTNDDEAATLTLVKILPNDNGGNGTEDDFTVYINDVVSSWGAHSVSAGSYVLSEDTLPGYTASGWGQDCDAQGNVTLLPGESKTCTIVNDDEAPTITLTKEVINDNGGQAGENDFGLTVGGIGVTSGQVVEIDANTPITLDEVGLTGYSFVSITGHRLCPEVLGGTVSLPPGRSITCTITNDDQQAYIVVDKTVVNDNGGTAEADDFLLTVDGNAVSDEVAYPVNPGTYTAGETLLAGYTAGLWGGDCDANGNVTLALGETKTCTITNNDQPGHVTVTKYHDHNANGVQDDGDETLDGWEIWLDEMAQWTGAQVAGQVTFSDLNPGNYTLSEQINDGWFQSNISCGNEEGIDSDNSHPVTVVAGQTTQCSIGNYESSTIIVKKDTIPDSEHSFDFALVGDLIETINFDLGDGGESTHAGLQTGLYTVSEEPDNRYTTTVLCVSNFDDEETANALDLDPGETITCTFTNTRKTGDLIVHKMVDEGDGNFVSADPGSFTWGLSENDTPNAMGSGVTLDTGTYDVFESTVGNYHMLGWFYTERGGDCTDVNNDELPTNVPVSENETTEITFCNARDTGTLRVNKFADTDGDGQYDSVNPSDFLWGTVSAQDANTPMGDSQILVTGDYNVYENIVPGYQFTGWFPGDPRENQFSCDNLPEGEQFLTLPVSVSLTQTSAEITLCNQLQEPILTISKTNDTAGDESPGGEVLFTIVVTATQSAAYNVQVTDLPSPGFTYVAGSWTAHSTLRGDLKGLGVTTEPTYASPGVWSLGTMPEGDVVTLTYVAKIAGDIKAGLYKDLVWAFGCIFDTDCSVGDGNDVLAAAVDPGFVSDSYAGTDVNIATSNTSGTSINVLSEQNVLGASTELPATGAQIVWLIIALLSIAGGIGLVITGNIMRRYHA